MVSRISLGHCLGSSCVANTGRQLRWWQRLPGVPAPDVCDISSSRPLHPAKEETEPASAFRGRSSLIVWVLVATLVPALICTVLTKILYPEWWQLVLYFWYSIPSNTFMHLPHEPAVIYAGTIYDPWLVAVVGGISTMVASIIDYFAVKRFFQLRGVAAIKQTAFYRMTVRWFRWRPWETIVIFAIAPLPYDPIRILAPSTNYPLVKYVTANVTGRVFLYYLLALGGAWIPIPPTHLIPIVMFITLTPLLYVLLAWRLKPAYLLFGSLLAGAEGKARV